MKTLIIYIPIILLGFASCGDNQSKQTHVHDNSIKNDPSTILRIISINPTYVASKEQQQQAQHFLTNIYPNNKIQCILKDTIEFVDQGQNFDSIICPLCGKNIETDFWQDAMEKADQNHFVNLAVNTPCCNKPTSLNDLKYITPAGFAKFILTIDDPETELRPEELSALEKILNTQVRIIHTHY